MEQLSQRELGRRANKIVKMIKQMDETFSFNNHEAHIRVCIMAAIQDALREGHALGKQEGLLLASPTEIPRKIVFENSEETKDEGE